MRTKYPELTNATPSKALEAEVKKHEAKEELAQVIGDAHEVLVKATTVWPFTLFPDTLTIDRTKLTITHREFFQVGEVLSIRIEDLLNVTATAGPFFGSIKLSTRFFDPGKPYTVSKFWRDDALKIKRIAQGYIIARQKDIDCSAIDTRDLIEMLDELGKETPAGEV